MKARRLLAALVCILVVGMLLPAVAGAAFVNSSGTSADAWWSSWNWEDGEPGPDDPVTEWYVGGMTGRGIFKDAGMPLERFNDTSGGASMYSYEPATGGQPRTWTQFSVFAVAPDIDLTFARALVSADMEFMAEGTTDVWYETEPWVEVEPDMWEMREPDETMTQMVSVVAAWQATGPLSRSISIFRDRSEDFYWADRSSSASRRARADVSIVGADGTAYLVEQLNDASISTFKGVSRFPVMPE